MHEFALYGQIRKDDHHQVLQQLAGVTRMQPQDTREIHLVFKARQPAGLDHVQSIGASNLASGQQQELQRVKSLLNAPLYYVQLIGDAQQQASDAESPTVKWTFEFKDTPDAGKQPVSSRLISRTPMEDGNFMMFLDSFGYEYVSRYMLLGSRFYDNDTTIFVHKVMRLPQVAATEACSDTSFLSDIDKLSELDPSGGYIVQASIDVVDGNNGELKERATRQLMSMKETLRQAVDLTPGDRLALDTKLPATSRRT